MNTRGCNFEKYNEIFKPKKIDFRKVCDLLLEEYLEGEATNITMLAVPKGVYSTYNCQKNENFIQEKKIEILEFYNQELIEIVKEFMEKPDLNENEDFPSAGKTKS